MRNRQENKVLLLLAVICIVSRIPELISNKLLLDGDECVVAIMAKHIMTGKAFFPLFYGQAYGFSLVECLFIIPFYSFFGITTLAVKCGMLVMWTIGVLFLYKTFLLINKSHKWIPLLLILVFIWSPAWAVWSMKARGGYLTAFGLTSIVLYLLFRNKKSYVTIFCMGVMTFFIYQSQSLWIPGLAPILAYFLLKDKKIKPFLFFILPVLLLSIATHFYKQGMLEFGGYKPVFSMDDLSSRITRIPAYLYCSLHGNYYFEDIQKPNFFCASLAIFFNVLVFALILVVIYNILKRKKGTMLFNISACGLPLTLASSICAWNIHGRYLLPIMGYTLLSLVLFLNTVNIRKGILYGVSYLYIAFGVVSLITFYDFAFLPIREKTLKGALAYMTDRGVHYAYCNNNMFTWQVIFYSNENVLCHEKRLPGRFPKYVWQVDSAYYYGGAKAAFISQPGEPPMINFPQSVTIDDYFIVIDPPKDIITKEFPRMTERPPYYYCKQ